VLHWTHSNLRHSPVFILHRHLSASLAHFGCPTYFICLTSSVGQPCSHLLFTWSTCACRHILIQSGGDRYGAYGPTSTPSLVQLWSRRLSETVVSRANRGIPVRDVSDPSRCHTQDSEGASTTEIFSKSKQNPPVPKWPLTVLKNH